MTKPVKEYFNRKLQDPEYRSQYDKLAGEYESKRKRILARLGAANQSGAAAFLERFQTDYAGLADLLDQLAVLSRYQQISVAIIPPGMLPYGFESASQSSSLTAYSIENSTS